VTVYAEARECTGRESPGTSSSQANHFRLRTKAPGIAPEDFPHLFEMFAGGKDPGDIRIGTRGWGCTFAASWWRPIREGFGRRILLPAAAVFPRTAADQEAYAGHIADCRGSTAL